ncbi:MAG TPA: PLP-dependent aminotransferase family protein, partial [Myxococcota bacterium]|nr:PLP-dependent aminotransferase family protein [Myxococcota bacterium]
MWLALDREEGTLQQRLYAALRRAILDGTLRPGARLPATRVLARELGVARNTAIAAYEQLADEGYVAARTGAGTRVESVLPDALPDPGRLSAGRTGVPGRSRAGAASRSAPKLVPPGFALGRGAGAAPRLSAHGERIVAGAPRRGVAWGMPRRHLPYDFRYGEPAYGDLPLETWWRLLGRRARRASGGRLAYGEPAGAVELRAALAGYLRRARGVVAEPEQILVTRGAQQAIDLVARLLVDPKARVALEEPHYTGFSLALAAYGARLVPIPVDDEGLDVAALERERGVRGVFATPSHQFPTGGVLSLERRLRLLAFAERCDAFVLEDDYDGEYRYEGRPLPSLQSLDRAERVLYVGTASKLLFPSLRIGWLVVPEPLARAFTLAKAYTDTGSATLEQLALADLIEGGHLERHVRRSRVRNAARREALRRAVERHLAGRAVLAGTRAGLHGLLWIPGLAASREAELRREAAARGVGIYPVHPFYARAPRQAGYVLGYASLEEAAIEEGVARLA